jgi:O-antigen/teichoic acid export membrane protein
MTFAGILSSSDRYVIGHYSGATSVGVYSAAYSIGHIITMVTSFVIYILWPTIFDFFDKDRIDEVKNYLSNSWRYLLMFSTPAAFGISILAEPLLGVMTAAEFIAEGRWVIPLVAFSIVIHGIGQMFSAVVLLSKQTRIIAIASGIAAAVNLGLNILLVPYWGVVAAAITTLIGYTIMALIMYYKARKYLKFETNPLFILKSILSSSIMAVIIWAINPYGVVRILLSIVLGAIVYLVILFIIRGFSKNELQSILRLLNGIIHGFRVKH